MMSPKFKELPNNMLTRPTELANTPNVTYISFTPQPRTSLKRSKKMIQITKYMKSLTIIPTACDTKATRYSMAESRLAFQTARRNLSSFITKIFDGRVVPRAFAGCTLAPACDLLGKSCRCIPDKHCLLDQRCQPP